MTTLDNSAPGQSRRPSHLLRPARQAKPGTPPRGRSLGVRRSSGQQVVGHWFGAQRLDFRPEDYWKAGSKITMKIDLDGVKGGQGITGVQSKTVSFTIGRSQVSTVDMKTQTMTVKRDGKTLKNVPISVKNSHEKIIKPDNGLNGWNMPWSEWQQGSAV